MPGADDMSGGLPPAPHFDRSASHHELREAAFRVHGADWAAAVPAWEALRRAHPDDLDGFALGIGALCENGQAEEAEQLAERALAAFGEHRRLLTEQALICFYTRAWPVARTRLAVLRERFPDERLAYTRGMEAAENLRDFPEAFAIMEAALARFPDDAALLADYAGLAERSHDAARIAAAWGEHRRKYGEERSFLGEARGLADAANPLAAETVLSEGLARYPHSTALAADAARLASRRADWAQARARWQALRETPGLEAEARSRIADAERFAAAGRRRPAPGSATGQVLGRPLAELLRRNWTFRFGYGQVLARKLVLGRGGELLHFYGDLRSWEVRDHAICLLDERGYVAARLDSVETRPDGSLRLSGRDCLHSAIVSDFVLEENRPPIQQILMEFDSLGDNCEFGLVQRFFQVEPVGILRFNWTELDSLMQCLADGFAELDRPDAVRVGRAGDGELIGHVDAYRFFYHTYRYTPDVDMARLAGSEQARLRYLADELLLEMQTGTKIYVRKGETAAEFDRIARLHERLRGIGPVTLLWVTETEGDRQPGQVEMIGDGLMRGWISEFAPGNEAHRAAFAEWERLCVAAHRLARPEAWAI